MPWHPRKPDPWTPSAKAALKAARVWRDSVNRTVMPKTKQAFGQRITLAIFSVDRYGFDEAYALAVQAVQARRRPRRFMKLA